MEVRPLCMERNFCLEDVVKDVRNLQNYQASMSNTGTKQLTKTFGTPTLPIRQAPISHVVTSPMRLKGFGFPSEPKAKLSLTEERLKKKRDDKALDDFAKLDIIPEEMRRHLFLQKFPVYAPKV